MNRIKLFSIILFCVLITVKGISLEKVNDREFDVFGLKLSPEEVQVEYSNTIKKFIDWFVNPCDSFEQYTCGNCNKAIKELYVRKPLPETAPHYKYTLGILNIGYKLTKDLDGNENYEALTAKDKLKTYYSSCLYQNKNKDSYFEKILNVLEPYGGVPFWNKNWKSIHFDWLKFSAFAAKFNIPILFETFDNKEIFIRPFNQRVRKDWKKNEEFINHILKSMGIEDQTATQIANQIISFKKALSEIGGGEDEETMRMGEFIQKYQEINWKSYFATLFEIDEANLELSEVVKVSGNNFTENIFELIKNTNSEILANYMGWQFLETSINYNPILNTNKFENLLYVDPTDRERIVENNFLFTQCFQELVTLNYPLLESLFFDEYYNNSLADDAIQMAYEIRSSFKRFLTNDEYNSTESDLEYLNSLKFEIDRPNVLSIKESNKLYENLEIRPKEYVHNWLNSRKFMTTRSFRDKHPERIPAAQIELLKDSHLVKIPVEYLVQPYFHRYLPEGLKFGNLGVLIAEKLVSQSPMYLNNTFNWKNKSKDQEKCYRKEFNVHSDSSNIIVHPYHMLARKLSFDSYNSRMKKLNRSGDEKLPELDLTENQLFFLIVAQQFCFCLHEDNDGISKTGMTFLANTKEFAEAFSCPLGSQMNPTKKCEFHF